MMTVLERNTAATVTGHGKKPMIFLHGFGCDQTMWRFVNRQAPTRFLATASGKRAA